MEPRLVLRALEESYERTARLVAHLAAVAGRSAPPGPLGEGQATVNDLLHITWMFTLANEGRAPDSGRGDLIGNDPGLALAAATNENLASWRQPGAFDTDI